MWKATAAMIAMLLVPAAGHGSHSSQYVLDGVIRQINEYPQLTIFDFVGAAVEDGVVTLTGKVTMPYKRTDIEKRVARVDGVRKVRNEVQVLSVSRFDEELRYRIARAIYGHPSFWNYAAMVNPPIRIVVDQGHVTLTGVVGSQVERMLARSLASSFDALSVQDELRMAADARAAVAQRIEQ
jgi:hyperosmotically inducible periplasmic protein